MIKKTKDTYKNFYTSPRRLFYSAVASGIAYLTVLYVLTPSNKYMFMLYLQQNPLVFHTLNVLFFYTFLAFLGSAVLWIYQRIKAGDTE